MLLSGCGVAQKPDAAEVTTTEATVTETTTEMTETTTEETTAETEKEEITEPSDVEPFTFDPHPHSDLLDCYCTEEMWNSLYNMCDAIRAGEDTFECPDQQTYEWCTDDVTIGSFMPPACTIVVGDGFDNGVGKLKYTIDKDAYHERQQAFEDEICRMLNEATRTDHSDFEKLVEVYDYMCKNFVYDYSELDGQGIDDFSNYACLIKKNGICCEVASALTYLLMQCGVEAVTYGESCYHDWTYVLIGGNGYFVDATWGLHGEFPDDPLMLQYFMMTEEARLEDGFDKTNFEVDLISYWSGDPAIDKFPATDTMFSEFRDWATFDGIDTINNVVRFTTLDGSHKELSYGEL